MLCLCQSTSCRLAWPLTVRLLDVHELSHTSRDHGNISIPVFELDALQTTAILYLWRHQCTRLVDLLQPLPCLSLSYLARPLIDLHSLFFTNLAVLVDFVNLWFSKFFIFLLYPSRHPWNFHFCQLFPKFGSTRRDVLNFATLNMFCYASSVVIPLAFFGRNHWKNEKASNHLKKKKKRSNSSVGKV